MSIRIGINGFGRMGRLALRAGWGRPGLEFVHVNEVKGGAECAAHLLEFDTVHGRWMKDRIGFDECSLSVEGARIGFTEHAKPGEIPWRELGVDVVLECSGKFRTPATLAPHFAAGADTVIVSAPVKEGALNIVYGVNHHLYDPEHKLLTAASCTTNCLAPVVKVIHEGLGIVHGSITTIHDVTNTQVIVDAPHKDLRRARSALNSLVPTSTGSATAITLIYPELTGKLNGIAVRVPLLNSSITDCCFEVARPTSVAEVNALFEAAANGPLAGILGLEKRPLVSADFVDDTRSAIVDGPATLVIDGTQVKVLAWYDNEINYVSRMIDLADLVAR